MVERAPTYIVDRANTEIQQGGVSPSFNFIVSLKGDMAQYGPDIRRFVEAMIYKLQKNAHKGRWEDLDIAKAYDLLTGEVKELEQAISDGGNMIELMLESADVANFALMVAAIAMERGR